MMKRLIFFVIFCSLFFSCSKNKNQNVEIQEVNQKSHEWFYFTKDGFFKTELPQDSVISSLKPWTESIRLSEANTFQNKGYLLVNKLGLLIIDENNPPVLIQDFSLFDDYSCSNLFFAENTPFITFSRSSFFNSNANLENSNTENPERPFLVRLNENSFFPVLTYGDLNLSSGGEITGTYFDGFSFVSSVKRLVNGKVNFSYIKIIPQKSLNSFEPFTSSKKINIEETNEDFYREKVSPVDFSNAPKRLQEVLSSLPKNFDFTVCVDDEIYSSPKIYSTKISGEQVLNANSILNSNFVCVIFSDGTTYFKGALQNREISNSGKITAFRLPKLPENYVYTDFCISNSTLAIGFEEQDFFKTGRSGFLTCNLEKILYK